MKRRPCKMMRKIRKHQKKLISFLQAIRLYAGMPVEW